MENLFKIFTRYYKPRWFGESWKQYDAVLTTKGVFTWYKKGSDPAELEGTLELKSIPAGLITIGHSTENIPKEQQVRFPRDSTFRLAIAIGEPYTVRRQLHAMNNRLHETTMIFYYFSNAPFKENHWFTRCCL